MAVGKSKEKTTCPLPRQLSKVYRQTGKEIKPRIQKLHIFCLVTMWITDYFGKKTVETLFKCPVVQIIPKQSHFMLIKYLSQQQFLLTKKFLFPLLSFLFLYLLDQTLFLLIPD